jgi:hypothetical protein
LSKPQDYAHIPILGHKIGAKRDGEEREKQFFTVTFNLSLQQGSKLRVQVTKPETN